MIQGTIRLAMESIMDGFDRSTAGMMRLNKSYLALPRKTPTTEGRRSKNAGMNQGGPRNMPTTPLTIPRANVRLKNANTANA